MAGCSDITVDPEEGNGLLLYQSYECYYCQKVVFALHEKKLKFQSHLVDLVNGDNCEPWFMELNPKFEVPVLKDGVKIIPDSCRIIDYLEDNFSNGDTPRLIPEKGSVQFQIMDRLRDLIDNIPIDIASFGCISHPELTGKMKMSQQELKKREGYLTNKIALLDEYAEKHKKFSDQYHSKKNSLQKLHNFTQDVNVVKKALQDVEFVLDEIEKELVKQEGKKKWLCGEKFTMADINLGVLLHGMMKIGLVEHYFKTGKYSNLCDYFKRIQQRDSYRRTMNQSSNILKSLCCMGTKDQVFLTLGSAAVIVCVAGIAAFILQRKKML